jgi:hypothetical protein
MRIFNAPPLMHFQPSSLQLITKLSEPISSFENFIFFVKENLSNMATTFTKEVLAQGKSTDKPKDGDTVGMQYTGWLYEESKADNDFKGKQ